MTDQKKVAAAFVGGNKLSNLNGDEIKFKKGEGKGKGQTKAKAPSPPRRTSPRKRKASDVDDAPQPDGYETENENEGESARSPPVAKRAQISNKNADADADAAPLEDSFAMESDPGSQINVGVAPPPPPPPPPPPIVEKETPKAVKKPLPKSKNGWLKAAPADRSEFKLKCSVDGKDFGNENDQLVGVFRKGMVRLESGKTRKVGGKTGQKKTHGSAKQKTTNFKRFKKNSVMRRDRSKPVVVYTTKLPADSARELALQKRQRQVELAAEEAEELFSNNTKATKGKKGDISSFFSQGGTQSKRR